MSAKVSPKTSAIKNATRSSGDSRSSMTRKADVSESETTADSDGSPSGSTHGVGNHGPT
ncbi:MAG: hypothetical protein R2710_13540 [Acidimicrobiales bacterium]